MSKYGVFSGWYFPVFGLNMKIYGVNLRIQFEYKKIRAKKNSIFGHFLRSLSFFNVCRCPGFPSEIDYWMSAKSDFLFTEGILYKVYPDRDLDLQKKWTPNLLKIGTLYQNLLYELETHFFTNLRMLISIMTIFFFENSSSKIRK